MTDSSSSYHIPVLIDDVLTGLDIQPGQWYIDGTVGGGGHAAKILERGGKVIGIDQDDEALAASSSRLNHFGVQGENFMLTKGNFRDLTTVIDSLEGGPRTEPIMGILLDLGVSSHQLDDVDRGFSFQSQQLDMRMDPSQGLPATELVAKLSERDLSQLFVDFGDERYARAFAKAIVRYRSVQPITSGQQLAEIIWQASPPPYRRGVHPATKVFQSLRMAVNAELPSLEVALPQAVSLLAPGGRIAVISFQSLEDRIVKRFFASEPQLVVRSKEPIVAGSAETSTNPRSRSAKLRVAEKL